MTLQGDWWDSKANNGVKNTHNKALFSLTINSPITIIITVQLQPY